MIARREGILPGVAFVLLALLAGYCLFYGLLRRTGNLQRMEMYSFPLDVAPEELSRENLTWRVSIEGRTSRMGQALEVLFLPLREAEAAHGSFLSDAELERLRQRYAPLWEQQARGE